ncbi:MAG: hypothetical protein GY953_46580 [bacterium]|nr:hypothetical protein [bacterium]
MLKFLNKARPQSPLLGKAAMWLVQNRDCGTYWNSTKQTALVIYGLVDYLKAGGELAPEFTAEVTVNGQSVLTRRFTRGEALSVEPVRVTLDASQLADGTNTIAFSKQGEGRLYWSIEREFYTTEESLSRAGNGSLNLRREYFKLTPVRDDDRIIHTLNPLDGEVATGDILAVRLTLSGSRWDYLLIEDPIPAGTEFIQRTDLYEMARKPDWWNFWSSRREFHDDRATYYRRTYWSDKDAEYVYLLKVVNPGRYRVSPARVMPMYEPEYLATTTSQNLEVK